MQLNTWNPGVWLATNWMYIVGWAALLTFAYKGYRIINNVLSYGMAITELRSDMDVIKNNHLPHVQEELQKMNENITGLREDLKAGLGRMADDLRLVLARMP